jgi:hypothetical protein
MIPFSSLIVFWIILLKLIEGSNGKSGLVRQETIRKLNAKADNKVLIFLCSFAL